MNTQSMPKVAELNIDLALKLREKKVSYRAIAARFKISEKTVKRRLKTYEPDKESLAFARKLELLRAEVPNEYCGKELNRLINFIRMNQAVSPESKYKKITDSIDAGARELEEIAEDCGLSRDETEKLLNGLIEQGRVARRERGGVANRGRKMKYHFYLMENTL